MTQATISDHDLDDLLGRVQGATRALIQGDVLGYFALVDEAPDYTLMPPTGGPTRHGSDFSPEKVEELEEFFAGSGDGEFELEQSYASGDLAVLDRETSVRPLAHDLHRAAVAPGDPRAHKAESHAFQHRLRHGRDARGDPRLLHEPRLVDRRPEWLCRLDHSILPAPGHSRPARVTKKSGSRPGPTLIIRSNGPL